MSITSPIFNIFGPSPIRPLQQHMEKTYACAEALLVFIDAVYADNWVEAEKLQEMIAGLENEADELKKQLRLHLPKGLFLPVPRTDLLEIISAQDLIANKSRDIAGLILGRKMVFPTAIAPRFKAYLQRSVAAARQAKEVIFELDELLEAGFSGSEVSLVENMIVQLDKVEHETDEIQVIIRRELFKIEKEVPPIDAMFLYKIIDWVGDLADRAQKVGGQLHLLLAR